jgi:DUF971 family protein
MTPRPRDVQLIGDELCIVWADGAESFFPAAFLRRHSPSAANTGETDIFGKRHGGDDRTDFPGVTIKGWDFQGNYAIRPWFSDGHSSGLFSWDYLKDLEKRR